MSLTADGLRAAVKTLYARKAEESDLWYPYCFAAHAAFGAIDRARAMGYSEAELKSVPQECIMGLGCGNPLSMIELAPGDTVLDLGCGGGMDAFLTARKVRSAGRVIGMDITEEMVRKARITAAHHRIRNAEFREGAMECLPVEDGSVSAVMSNFAVSLSPDKPRVFREAFRALKPGGRIAVCEVAAAPVGRPAYVAVPEETEAWLWQAAGPLGAEAYAGLLAEVGFEGVKIIWERGFAFDECGDSLRAVSVGIEARKPV